MTSQQKQQQQQQQIQFTIQTLDGETFQVSIPVTEAEQVYQETNSSYNHYGLDYLKDAICSSTGNDPVSQQLIGEEELTNRTPLIPLVDTVITLIVKPPFTIEFITPQSVHRLLIHPYPLFYPYSHTHIVCYLRSGLSNLRISALGIVDNYFKIAIADLISANAILQKVERVNLNRINRYIITHSTPTYVWLRFSKDHINIVETTQ
jgi:hypothetical protein